MGDGNLGKYPRCQYLRIYFNPHQVQYINYVTKLLIMQFGKVPYNRFRKDSGNIGVVYLEISYKDMSERLGFPVGSKIRNKIKIPYWIWQRKSYLKACIRGLFDTDGCTYITGGKYKIVNFTSGNPVLLDDYFKALQLLNFHPYVNSRHTCVEIGRMREVENFFKCIKPRNLIHYRFDKKAEVAKLVKAEV